LEERNYKIEIQIETKKYNLDQNEFWYFKFFLDQINSFYQKNRNKEKNILIKIPGTKKFSLVNRMIFKKLYNDVKNKISFYKKTYQYEQ